MTPPRSRKQDDDKYNHSKNGRKRYERGNEHKRDLSEERYLSKEFVAWDGEGGNNSDGSHTYFLLSNSDGNSIRSEKGISATDALDFFLNARHDVTNIIYGGNYDINMILKGGVSLEALQKLYKEGKCRWRGYWLEWRPGKSFTVKKGNRSFTLFDILPFFQKSFVGAMDEYFNSDWPNRDRIISEKSRRGNFDWSEIDEIGLYNASELVNTVALANELRSRLFKVNIRVKRWDGPGAIAACLYQKYQIKSHLPHPPEEVISAGRFAYAGGRFEIIRKGHSLDPAHQFDIRSAYPSAARYLPCCNPSHGRWVHRTFTDGPIKPIRRFGLYRIEVVNPWTTSRSQPQPLWVRNKDGTVYFTEWASGWYWSPEAELVSELGGVNIYEAWEWRQNCNCEPFSFVEPLYNKRAALKKAGDGANVGLKLGLNSLYGKLAQQIGYDPGPPLRLPPYHSLEWAGYITSHCRAQMYRAAMLDINSVIAFETDAIFSTTYLPLKIGGGLGDFEHTKYRSLTYLKSGFYFGTLDDGSEISKSRGFNKGTVTREQVIEALQNEDQWSTKIPAEQTRFIGLGTAMMQGMDKWCRWITAPRDITVGLTGKRTEVYDTDDLSPNYDATKGWYETVPQYTETEFSYQYPVAWANDNLPSMASPEGLQIDEFRIAVMHEQP